MAYVSEKLAKSLAQKAMARTAQMSAIWLEKWREDERAAKQEAPLNADEQASMDFILAYLPESDLQNHDYSFWLKHCRETLSLCDEFVSDPNIRDALFLNYILMPRVNSENIELCRQDLAELLRPLVQGKSAEEKVQAVNYFSFSKGTYQSTNSRSVSPLTFIKRAGGRCGEESTFVVSALRSVGIPARQIYSPFWAHTDDNHAWVEAYVDGNWRYFGACEPEATLDCGWFDGSARRAAIVLTRSFTDLLAPGDLPLDHVDPAGLVNVSARYFEPTSLDLVVKGAAGQKFWASISVVNYAAVSPILRFAFTSGACVHADLAKASFVLQVGDGEKIYEKHLRLDEPQKIELDWASLGEMEDLIQAAEAELAHFYAPPAQSVALATVDEAQKAQHEARYQQAEAERKAFEASFGRPDQEGLSEVRDMGFDPKGKKTLSEADILFAARASREEISKFLNREASPYTKAQRLRLLNTLELKDYADTPADLLETYLKAFEMEKEAYASGLTQDEFDRYLLCPRFGREMLSAYREGLNAAFDEKSKAEFKAQPERIAAYIEEHIALNQTADYALAHLEPLRCLKWQSGSEPARKLLAMAMARSFGIPCRYEAMTGRAVYLDFETKTERPLFGVTLDEQKPDQKAEDQVEAREGVTAFKKAQLSLVKKDPEQELRFSEQFSLEVLEKGKWRFVNPELIHLGKGVSKAEIELAPGWYMWTQVRRLPSGDQLIKRKAFHLEAGQEERFEVALLEAPLEDQGRSALPEFSLSVAEKGAVQALLSSERFDPSACHNMSSQALFDEGRRLFIFFEANGEPFSHLMQDLESVHEALAQEAKRCVLVGLQASDLEHPRVRHLCRGWAELRLALMDESLPKTLYHLLTCPIRELPLVCVADEKQEVAFSFTGYRVNSGTEILQALKDI